MRTIYKFITNENKKLSVEVAYLNVMQYFKFNKDKTDYKNKCEKLNFQKITINDFKKREFFDPTDVLPLNYRRAMNKKDISEAAKYYLRFRYVDRYNIYDFKPTTAYFEGKQLNNVKSK